MRDMANLAIKLVIREYQIQKKIGIQLSLFQIRAKFTFLDFITELKSYLLYCRSIGEEFQNLSVLDYLVE